MQPMKVSREEAIQVLERIKTRQASLCSEARRLGCSHVALRKACRRAIGLEAYASLIEAVGGSNKRKLREEDVPQIVSNLKQGAALRTEAKRIGCSEMALYTNLRHYLGVDGYKSLQLRGDDLTRDQALAVYERMKADRRLTLCHEADRLQCHHVTLRRGLRKALGASGLADLMRNRRRATKAEKPTDRPLITDERPDPPVQSSQALNVSPSVEYSEGSRRPFVSPAEALRRAELADTEFDLMWATMEAASQAKVTEDPPSPPVLNGRKDPRTCTHDRLHSGTDGNGQALLECFDCGYREAVVRRLPDADERVRTSALAGG